MYIFISYLLVFYGYKFAREQKFKREHIQTTKKKRFIEFVFLCKSGKI